MSSSGPRPGSNARPPATASTSSSASVHPRLPAAGTASSGAGVLTSDGNSASAKAVGSRPLQPRLARALEVFRQSFAPAKRGGWSDATLAEVEQAIDNIQTTLGSQRRLPNLARAHGMIRFIENLTIGAVDPVMVSGAANPLWGSLRHVLEEASKKSLGMGRGEYIDKVLEILAQLGAVAPHLEDYRDLFSRHPEVLSILDNFKEVILTFSAELTDIFSKPSWKAMFDSSWKRFSNVVENSKVMLVYNRELLRDAKAAATVREVKTLAAQAQEGFASLSDKLTSQHDQLLTRAEQDAVKARRESQLRDVLSKLAPPRYLDDQSSFQKRMHQSARGEWLLGDPSFVRWSRLDSENQKVLSLNGCPGAGKTFLVSSVVEHLREMQSTPTDTFISVVYFYFRHDNEDQTTFSSALRALIAQLVTEEGADIILDYAYQQLALVAKPQQDGQDLLMNLAKTAIHSKRVCFAVLDGLDECRAADQATLLHWLKDVMDGVRSSTCSFRLLLSGRREGWLEESVAAMDSALSVQVESSAAHRLSIRKYVEKEASIIQRLFRSDDDIRSRIVDKIMAKSEGMFLFAYVVLECLRDCLTAKELADELEEDTFPEGLQEAYDRVALKVFKPQPGLSKKRAYRAEVARQLLLWISCAARPLYWREVQARLIIDPAVGPSGVSSERALTSNPKDLCGCFIDVSGEGDESDKVVHIVHRSAAEYLAHTGRIPPAREQHIEMLGFCCRYLNSDAFTASLSTQDLEQAAATGYYAFQEYAIAHWWDHARALWTSLGQSDVSESLPHALQELATLIASYSRNAGEILGVPGPTTDLGNLEAVANLDPASRTRHDLFLFEHRVRLTREAINTVRAEYTLAQETAAQSHMQLFYGCLWHKCPKPWCKHFHRGFESEVGLRRHIHAHDRPFKCYKHDCLSESLGFATEIALWRHQQRCHPGESEVEVRFPPNHSNEEEEQKTQLLAAIKDGRLDVIQELITPANINEWVLSPLASGGGPPLVEAIRCGRLEVCEYLLAAGADPNWSKNRAHVTPLRTAIIAQDLEILRLLLSQPGIDHIEKKTSWSHAGKARHRLSSDFRYNTLGFATATSSMEFILPLLQKRELAEEEEWHCLQAACASGNPGRGDIFRFLQERITFTHHWREQKKRVTLFCLALQTENFEVAGTILLDSAFLSVDINETYKEERTPLSYAAEAGNLACIRAILAVEGVVVAKRCAKGRSPFAWAAVGGHLESLKALYARDPSAVENADMEGKTPLFHAAEGLHLSCVHWLLETASANINHRAGYGRTVLTSLAAFRPPRGSPPGETDALPKVVEMLIARSPGIVDATDGHYMSPLHLFAYPTRRRGVPAAVDVLLATGAVDVNRPLTYVPESVPEREVACAGQSPLEISLKAGECPGKSRVLNLGVAGSLIATRRIVFFALDGTRQNGLLRACLAMSQVARGTMLIDMIAQGLRPSFREALCGFSTGDDGGWIGGDVTTAAHLLATMDRSIPLQYVLEPECLELLELEGGVGYRDPERMSVLAARHPAVAAAVRRAIEDNSASEAQGTGIYPVRLDRVQRASGAPSTSQTAPGSTPQTQNSEAALKSEATESNNGTQSGRSEAEAVSISSDSEEE